MGKIRRIVSHINNVIQTTNGFYTYINSEFYYDADLFINSEAILDAFYNAVGLNDYDYVHNTFKAPACDSNKIVAWYKTTYKTDKAIECTCGDFKGFIPNCIENILLGDFLTVDEKYNAVKVMVDDLKGLKGLLNE